MSPPIQSFDDFSKKFVKGFDQVKQFAAEKMGTAQETTSFPPAFIKLDEKVDKVKVMFDGLLRVTKQLYASDNSWTILTLQNDIVTDFLLFFQGLPIGDSIMGAMDKLNLQIDKLRNKNGGADDESQRSPMTIQQATSEICLDGAELLSKDSFLSGDVPAADLLQRYGQIQSKLAEARLDFNRTLYRKFIEPFSTYAGAYENVNNAKRNAQRVRLELDAAKARLRNIRGMRPAELQDEVDLLEKEFSSACEEAIQDMKTFVQYTEATHCIEAVIQAQLSYHRKAGEILAALSG